jgi:hypothetical protein
MRLPFSRIWITASSSLEVPNSVSRAPLAAESRVPWLPCLFIGQYLLFCSVVYVPLLDSGWAYLWVTKILKLSTT